MLTILQGDAREKLFLEFPSELVQCCVTSPPYWGLRDYGTATWEGGDYGCNHTIIRRGQSSDSKQATNLGSSRDPIYSSNCLKCGAKRIDSQIGLEETPEQYVTKLVEVFRELRRVLRKDGTLWLNLGDSYATQRNDHDWLKSVAIVKKGWHGGPDLKPKDLCGIPWRVAFALQADGWYLRSDIIWHKPNPMPESVTDRPTKAHEYLFLLSKNERYYYDAEAIREPHSEPWRGQGEHESSTPHSGRLDDPNKEQAAFTVAVRKYNPDGRNKRSVWTVPTEPYAEAHFATFPSDLIKPCILAGSRPDDTILDPFGGSGTTGAVAIELGRKAILIELNPAYIPLIKKRCAITPGFQFMNPSEDVKPPETPSFHEIL